MNIREALLYEHSRKQAEKVARFVMDNPEYLNELFEMFLANESIITQRAAYSVSILYDWKPALLNNYLVVIIQNLLKPNLHDAVKRNSLRIFEKADLNGDEEMEGVLADICFRYLESAAEPVAIKAFSLTVLERIVQKYPELKFELKAAIEREIEFQTPAFVGRGKKILKKLNI